MTSESIISTTSQLNSSTIIQLHLDTLATPSSLYTRTKTSRRTHYDSARARHSVDPAIPSDVLLYDDHGRLTETSVRNVAFFREGAWYTPADETGCLPGVARRWLLEHNRIIVDTQGVLTKESVRDGEMALVFNAVEGCRVAIIRTGQQ
jgi:4-amino-4-deoxychorismate lyase